MMGTSNLINHDFIIVQDRMLYQSRGFHLVYVDVTMVILRDLVPKQWDITNYISSFSTYIRGNSMLVIVNLAILYYN